MTDYTQKYGEASRQDGPAEHQGPPDPDQLMVYWLKVHWTRLVKQPLPAPCPQDFMDCARWWRIDMQEPKQRGENREVPLMGKDATGTAWICGYHIRLRMSLSAFMALEPKEREFVVAARDDGIFYHGEKFEHFQDVVNETMAMRKIGVHDYRKQALGMTDALLRATGGRKESRVSRAAHGFERLPEYLGKGPCLEAQ